MPKTKPHNKAHTTLHNWKLRLQDPDFNKPLSEEVTKEITDALLGWELKSKHNLKKLDSIAWLLEELFTLAFVKQLPNIDWLVDLRYHFINKCIDYFGARIRDLMDGYAVQRNDDKKAVNVSKAHIKKYEERIKIYTLWTRSANIVKPQ